MKKLLQGDTKCNHSIALFLTIVALTFAWTAKAGDEAITGIYAAISESEWDERLALAPDGKATLTTSTWLAGQWDKRLTQVYSGRWTADGNAIDVHLNESAEQPGFSPVDLHLQYRASLSLKEIGRSEAIPGLVNLEPGDESLLWSRHLWREDALRDLEWP